MSLPDGIWAMEAQARAIQCEDLLLITQTERDALRAANAKLREALIDAEWLLRKVGINWKDAASMKDSCLRSADDARAALQSAGKE